MKDPRLAGHTPILCCDNGCEESCGKCEGYWPCSVVSEYDAKVRARERRKNLPTELDQLTERVNALEQKTARQGAYIGYLEAFVLGAALPIFRDLLTTHATGSLEMPSARYWTSSGRNERNVESGCGIGVNFKANGGAYVYEATDGRVYTDGRVTRGASVEKVAEQRRRMGQ